MSVDPVTDYSTARGYVQSAYLLMSNPARYQAPDDTSFFLPFHMICGFAVELYLKSFLAKEGYDEKKLRSFELRHDLHNLYEVAHSRGFVQPNALFLVGLLGEKHKSFEFRYMKVDSQYRSADLRAIFAAFSVLDTEIDKVIGASAAIGRSPGTIWTFPDASASWRFPA